MVYSDGFHDMVINSNPKGSKSLVNLLLCLPYSGDPVFHNFYQLDSDARLALLSNNEHTRDQMFRLFVNVVSYDWDGQNWHIRSVPDSDIVLR